MQMKIARLFDFWEKLRREVNSELARQLKIHEDDGASGIVFALSLRSGLSYTASAQNCVISRPFFACSSASCFRSIRNES